MAIRQGQLDVNTGMCPAYRIDQPGKNDIAEIRRHRHSQQAPGLAACRNEVLNLYLSTACMNCGHATRWAEHRQISTQSECWKTLFLAIYLTGKLTVYL